MRESDQLLDMGLFVQRYQDAEDNAIRSLQLLSHYVRESDISDLKERIQKEYAQFYTSFVCNVAMNVGRTISFFLQTFMEGMTICKERILSEKELDDLVKCSRDRALQVFHEQYLGNEIEKDEGELKRRMETIADQLKTDNHDRQQRQEQLILSALAVGLCAILNRQCFNDDLNEKVHGDYAIGDTEFQTYCSEARERAQSWYKRNDSDESGRNQLRLRLDEKEASVWKQRSEFIKAHGLTVMVKSDRELHCLDPKTTRLIVSANSCNDIQAFTPSTSLVDLEIQDNSLAQCSSVKWEELTHLHTIAIGDNCFTEASSLPMILSICSFPSLQSVTIGNNSFRYWKEFRLNELPALTTLQIGTPGQESNCFVSASLVIRSWHTLLVS